MIKILDVLRENKEIEVKELSRLTDIPSSNLGSRYLNKLQQHNYIEKYKISKKWFVKVIRKLPKREIKPKSKPESKYELTEEEKALVKIGKEESKEKIIKITKRIHPGRILYDIKSIKGYLSHVPLDIAPKEDKGIYFNKTVNYIDSLIKKYKKLSKEKKPIRITKEFIQELREIPITPEEELPSIKAIIKEQEEYKQLEIKNDLLDRFLTLTIRKQDYEKFGFKTPAQFKSYFINKLNELSKNNPNNPNNPNNLNLEEKFKKLLSILHNLINTIHDTIVDISNESDEYYKEFMTEMNLFQEKLEKLKNNPIPLALLKGKILKKSKFGNPEITKKDLKVFKKEIYDNMLGTFDLLNNIDLLETFLSYLTEQERERLYSHELLSEFDLLP
ncbi:hypothetical protein ES702_07822 [subsurface metagenome]